MGHGSLTLTLTTTLTMLQVINPEKHHEYKRVQKKCTLNLSTLQPLDPSTDHYLPFSSTDALDVMPPARSLSY